MGSIQPASKLFQPLKVGNMTLSNRIAMAPLTRFRADDAHVPTAMVAEYYAQRASVPGTLLVTEATYVSPASSGYANTPGAWDAAQVAGWRQVTDAVHARGSFIFAQLWALGRTATASVKESEATGDVVSASAVRLDPAHAVPRPLDDAEIRAYIAAFADAARNAVAAGFDGVEIHGANGYLVDQFLQDVVNQRTDAWGGSVEKRSRFAVEVAKAVVAAIGAERTGIRLSPWGTFQGMGMKAPLPQFGDVIGKLRDLDLAYLHLVESRVDGATDKGGRTDLSDPLLEIWGAERPVILAGGFDVPLAKATVDDEYKDRNVVIAFGRHFISTPDLVFRAQRGIDFNPYDRQTFYFPGAAKGYTDYPFSEEFLREHPQKL